MNDTKNKERPQGAPSRELVMAVIMRRLFDYARNEVEEIVGAVCYPPSLPKSIAISVLIEKAIRSGGVVMEGPVEIGADVEDMVSSQTFRLLYKSLENMGMGTVLWSDGGRRISGIDLTPAIKKAMSIPREKVERERWIGTAIYTMVCKGVFSIGENEDDENAKRKDRDRIGPIKIISLIQVADFATDDLVIRGELLAKKKISDFDRKIKKLTGLVVDSVGTSYFVASSLIGVLVEYGLIENDEHDLRLNYKMDKDKKRHLSRCFKLLY